MSILYTSKLSHASLAPWVPPSLPRTCKITRLPEYEVEAQACCCSELCSLRGLEDPGKAVCIHVKRLSLSGRKFGSFSRIERSPSIFQTKSSSVYCTFGLSCRVQGEHDRQIVVGRIAAYHRQHEIRVGHDRRRDHVVQLDRHENMRSSAARTTELPSTCLSGQRQPQQILRSRAATTSQLRCLRVV